MKNETRTLLVVGLTLAALIVHQAYYLSYLDDKISAEIERANQSIVRSTQMQNEVSRQHVELKKVNQLLTTQITDLKRELGYPKDAQTNTIYEVAPKPNR